ncbi:MAG: hypothetical protein QXD43_02530 [Candidatus Aenigmatarchaeota archaeon]
MKGQTAIEYLMTYGWAILIILIVAGVLAYYGIFAPSGFLAPTARGFGTLQVRSPWSISTDGTITLDVENRVGQSINITDIYVTIGTWTSGHCDASQLNEVENLASGNHKMVQCNLGSISPTPNVGEQYTATVTIQYTTDNTYYFNSTGTISGTYS